MFGAKVKNEKKNKLCGEQRNKCGGQSTTQKFGIAKNIFGMEIHMDSQKRKIVFIIKEIY
jgi:hypothetical protein